MSYMLQELEAWVLFQACHLLAGTLGRPTCLGLGLLIIETRVWVKSYPFWLWHFRIQLMKYFPFKSKKQSSSLTFHGGGNNKGRR